MRCWPRSLELIDLHINSFNFCSKFSCINGLYTSCIKMHYCCDTACHIFLDRFCTSIWYLSYSIHVALVKLKYIKFYLSELFFLMTVIYLYFLDASHSTVIRFP